MWEVAALFLFCVIMVVGPLGVSVWLIATGQAAGVGGLFLLASCLVLALAFGWCLRSLVKRPRKTGSRL